QSTGSTGAGSSIRLRGNTSVALSNQPLIYIDGVRVRSDEYPKNVPPAGSNLRSTNYYASPLNDINPDDIERIEVLKGAAATTLYGTEAAAGVIQIFTKRGSIGAPSWDFETTQGFNRERPFGLEGVDPTDTPAGNNAAGLTLNAFRRNRNYYGSANIDTISQVLQYQLNTWINRVIIGGTVNYAPITGMTNKFTVGLDRANVENRNLRPFGF